MEWLVSAACFDVLRHTRDPPAAPRHRSWFSKAVRVVRRVQTRVGPADERRGQRRTSLVPVRVGRKEGSVRVASHARIELVRIDETEPQLLPVRLRLTTGAVRRIQAKGVVIQAREGAPRHALILIRPHAASSYFTRESGVRADRHNCRTNRNRKQSFLAHHPSPNAPIDVGQATYTIKLRLVKARSSPSASQDPPRPTHSACQGAGIGGVRPRCRRSGSRRAGVRSWCLMPGTGACPVR
jgi:hypothetical protein